ncbi:MAG TPA: PAS domain S-box protein [Candidatus Binatia bacterium]|jgi:PAS domain S-box-containing protein|nr:PAS domain S-box protein [Candidatus Binatia bacterium]
MPRPLTSPARFAARYGGAFVLVALAFFLRIGLSSSFGPGLIYITFYPAVMLAALLGRLGPGLVATALSALLADWWLIAPQHQRQNPADLFGLAVFSFMGVLMSVVAELYHRERDKTAAYEKDLATRQTLDENVVLATERNQKEAELQKVNRTLKALKNSSQAMLRAASEADYLKEVCRIVVEDCGHAMVWIGFAEEDPDKTVRPAAYSGFEAGYLETLKITWADTERGRGPTGTAIRTGTVQACRNVLIDPALAPWREEALKRGYASSIALPLVATAGARPLGALTIYSNQPDSLSEDEARLLTDLAGDLAYGINFLRLRAAHAEAEEALRSSQARLAGIVGSAMDAIISVDAEQRIVFFNASAERMFRCPASEAMGQSLDRFVPERFRDGHRDALRGFGAVGTTSRAMGNLEPLAALRADGEEFPIEASISQGEIRGQKLFTVILRDITLRREAERRAEKLNAELEQRVTERTAELSAASRVLLEGEQRYRSLVTASAQIVWTTDAQGQVVVEMPTWQEFTGQTHTQYQGSGWSQAVHPDDRQRTTAVWARAVSTRAPYETEYRLRRHDGEYRNVVARGVPVIEEDGAIREWVGTCTDVTQRKDAERRREFTSTLLALFARKAASREYLESVVQVLREWSGCQAAGIRLLDDRQEIPYEAWAGFAPAFIELESRLSLGSDNCCCTRAVTATFEDQDRPLLTPAGSYRCNDTTGFIAQLPEEKRARYRGNCQKFGFASLAVVPIRYRGGVLGAIHLADPRPDRFPLPAIEFVETMAPLLGEAIHRFQAEAELAKYKDRLEELVLQRTRDLEDANARLQIEIADRKHAQESLQLIAQDLARSNRDLEQFAYVASHDLQEPLRAVGGFVKLLQRRFLHRLDEKGLEYIAGAVEGASRMERLITDLLAFSRVGSRAHSFAPADLNALLEDALRNLQVSLKTARATVTHDPLPTLPVDATQLILLFQNLLGNAVKFHSDLPPEIHVGAQKLPDRWVLSVRDNGIGIDPRYFARIFQIFQRLHTRKHYPGTGIGLAICKKIAERHGGAIWVESQPGQGATFYFSIPEKSAINDTVI